MEVDPKPGMWITQNLVSHQGDYYIMHVKDVNKQFVTIDVKINISKSSATGHVYPGKWSTNFGDKKGVYQYPRYIFGKQMFQKMKRPSADIRRAAVKSLFMYERS